MPEAPPALSAAPRCGWTAEEAALPIYRATRWSSPVQPANMRRFAGGFGLLVHEAGAPTDEVLECISDPGQEHVLFFALESAGQRFAGRVAGAAFETAVQRDQGLVLPAGSDIVWRSLRGRDRTLHLHVSPGWLATLAAESGLPDRATVLVPSTDLRNPGLSALLATMRRQLETGPPGAAFSQHWAMLVALLVMRHSSALPSRGGGIAPQRLAAVRDHVEANLAEDVGLDDMAAVAGLSRFHFARAFRRATGMTPHAFVTARRVERAKQLIDRGGMGLAEIGLACGFGGQSHFTTAFRQVAGVTPGQWRARGG